MLTIVPPSLVDTVFAVAPVVAKGHTLKTGYEFGNHKGGTDRAYCFTATRGQFSTWDIHPSVEECDRSFDQTDDGNIHHVHCKTNLQR